MTKKDKRLYIIAGCNGAGKTTASFNILPTILNCKEFINADEIARGLSPFQPESVNFEAGRIMLQRINELLTKEVNFAFETTLSSKTYRQTIIKAREKGYYITLLFFWLESVALALQRVEIRVNEGGHHISQEIIERRYKRGLDNLFNIYLPICDTVMIFDNSDKNPNLIMQKSNGREAEIINTSIFKTIKYGRKGSD